MRKLTLLFGVGIAVAAAIGAAAEETTNTAITGETPIVLWTDGAPGAHGFADVDIPTLTPYPAPAAKATGAAMVVCPGGGYHMLAQAEGEYYARWLNEMGISAYVLKYRLASSDYHHPAMWNDASRAMRLVRANAEQWHIDPSRVGIIGSSAGGHLASTLLTHYDAGESKSEDPIERQSSRPDLGILCYPVITMGEFTHGGSKQNLLGNAPSESLVHFMSNDEQVTSDTPPTFLFHTSDDSVVPVENSLKFAAALAGADVDFELHVYPHGRHGMSLGTYTEWDPSHRHAWTIACKVWLTDHNFARK